MDFTSSPSGKVVKNHTGFNSYIPNPLPPKINWSDQLVSALSNADFLLGKLSREGSRLPNPHLLMRPFITREAVLSSKIEGTQTTLGQVLAQDAGATVNQDPNDLQEVQNYVEALDFGMQRLKDLPLSLRLIKEVHEKLMQGVRGSHATPGEFRKSQNWIGPAGCTLNTAKFVPPPIDELHNCLSDLELYLHNRELPTLVHIAMCHYQFEAIHPFLDGNGRVGRLLITLLLIEREKLTSPLLYLSAFFEATRPDYYKMLLSVSRDGTWEDWLTYFLNGVALQSEDALSRAERINALLDKWKLKAASINSKSAVSIIEHFAVNPFLTVNQLTEKLGIAYTTTQRAINKLEEVGIITQTAENKRGKVYCAKEILAILEETTLIKPIIE